jgi:hypothetical protein
LHPQFSGDDFEELAGMTGLENFLSPVQMENVEGQSGGTIDPYQEELAASQYLILNTPRSIKYQSISGPRIMQYYIDQIVAACIANLPENEGRSRDNNNQPCSESNLFDTSITYLASGLLQIPTEPSTIKIPISMSYTLPGIGLTTSVHNIIYTYTIQ